MPIDQKVCEASDSGVPFIVEHAHSSASKAFMEMVKKIGEFLKTEKNEDNMKTKVK